MKIDKIINNNVISVTQNNQEHVVMGKGIGFQKQEGDIVEESKIDKIFDLSSQEISDRFKTLLIEVPIEVVQAVEKIIEVAKIEYNKDLSDTIYVALTDHINFAIERQQEGMAIKNGLLWEIKKFYPTEYEIGVRALDWIDEIVGVKLPIDEAAFVAIHLLNAEHNNLADYNQVTEMVQNILSLVKYHFRLDFDEESLTYFRFVTHLKFLAQRIFSDNPLDTSEIELYDIVKEKYKTAFKCVKKIEVFLLKKYQYEMTRDEALYLTIHIQRLISRNESVDN
ncbi:MULTISPECIES: BglG family transcription antiterminator LicT [Mammaliicoccus]|jgi:beta-glucoside operon transcriptional antiterminator|uniref:PRD domain-containing protein n=1 Tax=Mammaliicoccus lentus TaxID=42858 RepID=A0AAX3W4Y6_MAMLE|nr:MULTISPECIES: PRD domain-containing protein [Mammaliicoccus]HIS19139.1 PRD domain-containing protein [Candidatus Coprovivens excrementavium]MBF0748922.1 PRD domain-containing protein [Mammaliicoccus lentus]MBU6113441.1 PRD domain-containing protein [Mammaliicoccus lentus]MBW0762226.1 PRD domain-containing protein [Mammaliicoccus lentus]MBW0766243.1 PRD domain-containing protein [Mammaliicoccus lentus]